VLTKRCYIPHARRQLVQESMVNQVKTVILQSYSNTSRCVFINQQTRWTMEHVSAVAVKTKASSLINSI